MLVSDKNNDNGTNPPPRFIKRAELSRRISVSIKTIDLWRSKRILPSYKIGGVILFDWQEIKSMIKANVEITHGRKRSMKTKKL